MVEVWILDCEPLKEETVFQSEKKLLSFVRQEKIEKCKTMEGKILSLGAGILLRHMLEQVGLREKEISFTYKENGKPMLPETAGKQYYVNLSHSGNKAAGIVADFEVGIDLEKIKKEAKTEKIAKRFFTEKEAMWVLLKPEEEKLRFFRMWTRKECYVKVTGKGMKQDFASFEMLPFESTSEASDLEGWEQDGFFFRELFFSPDYALTIGGTKFFQGLTINHLDLTEKNY